MAIDEELRRRVRKHVSRMSDIEEKPMVGGVGFIWRGSLLCGVMGADLLVRVARDDHARFLGDDGAKPMVMGGRAAKGWLLVPGSIGSQEPVLVKWIERARDFVGSLPAK